MLEGAIIGAVVGIIVSLIIYFFDIYSVKTQSNVVSMLKKYGKIQRYNKKVLMFTLNNENYYLFLWKVKKNSTVSFNSKKIWAASLGSKISRKDFSFITDLEGKKMVIVFPNDEQLKYYINECEVGYVDPNVPLWNDTNVIKYSQLEIFLKDNFKSL